MNYERFILFKTTIAHELLIDGYLELLFDGELNEDFLNKPRRYKVFIKREYIERQSIPAESSSFSKMAVVPSRKELEFSFSFFVSKIEIQLEVFEEEIGAIRNYSPNKSSIIFQSLLLSFSRYYNEAMKGNDFFKPSVNGYGPQIFSLQSFGKDLCTHIAGSFSLMRNHREKINSRLTQNDFKHIPWRYYYYKAVDCYDIGEYLDSIIWSAVSIETYVMDKIRKAGLMERINNTTSSFFFEVRQLKKAEIISAKEAKLANKSFSKMNSYRNEIVHGDIDSTFYSEKRAKECIRVLKNFYNESGIEPEN